MNPIQAIILGIIQGLTEWLPISSTAHLRVAPALLGWEGPGAAFTAVIQLGTLVAVLYYFRADILKMTRAFFRGLRTRQPFADPDSRMAWLIIVGTIPVVFAGLLLKKHIEGPWRSLYVICAAMIVVALLMVAAEELVKIRLQSRMKQKQTDRMTWFDSLLIGFCQALALIPGTSRSGSTITGGLFLGLSREAAARFSFLLSLPAVLAAAVKELYDERETLLASRSDIVNLLLATVVAGIVGYASIVFLLRYLRTHTMHAFVIYRIGLGLLLLSLLWAGMLQPDEKKAEDNRSAALQMHGEEP